MIGLSFNDAPKQFRAAALAMKMVENPIKRAVNASMRETMNPVWKSGVSSHLTGSSRFEAAVLTSGAKITGGNPPQLVTASSTRGLGKRKAVKPVDAWPGYEYGASDRTADMKSKKGKKYTRHVMRHLPRRSKRGRVIEPTVVELLPRIASFWVQSVVKIIMDAAEKRN